MKSYSLAGTNRLLSEIAQRCSHTGRMPLTAGAQRAEPPYGLEQTGYATAGDRHSGDRGRLRVGLAYVTDGERTADEPTFCGA